MAETAMQKINMNEARKIKPEYQHHLCTLIFRVKDENTDRYICYAATDRFSFLYAKCKLEKSERESQDDIKIISLYEGINWNGWRLVQEIRKHLQAGKQINLESLFEEGK